MYSINPLEPVLKGHYEKSEKWDTFPELFEEKRSKKVDG